MILPEVKSLELQLEKLGEEDFGKYWLNRMQRADAVMGDPRSHSFIKPFTDYAYNKSNQIFVEDEMAPNIQK